jgi:hypothetical protein
MNSQHRLALVGLALGVLFALLLAPQTRWLVRPQLAPSLISDAQSRRQFVRDHPNDYPVQLGGPTIDPVSQTPADSSYAGQLRAARSLVSRFPDNPSLRANLLRYATQELHLNRPDSSGNLLSGKPDPPPDPRRDGPPPTPAQLAAFDADAAAGERLDPDNAYFPFMRSVGLFAAHRDAEGLAAVRRAGTKTAWREYYEDEVEGRWRIQAGIYGGREAVASSAVAAGLLFPHYQVLRAAARLATVKAVEEEQAGRAEDGLALRRSLARCGDLMRAESNSYIGTLVGIAISAVSRSRPGGASPITAEPGAPTSLDSNDRLARRRLDAYCGYVTRLGHPEAVREARAQAGAGEQARHLSFATFAFGSRLSSMTRLAIALFVSWVLAANLLLLLLLGWAAWGLGRLPRIRARRPLPAGASVGVWAVLLLSLTGLALFHDTRPEDAGGVVLTVAVFLLVPLAFFTIGAVLRPAFRQPFGQAVLAGLVTLAALGVLAGLAAWETHGADTLATIFSQTLSLSGSDGTPNVQPTAQAQLLLGIAFGTALPLLLAIILGIAARVRRVPASVGLMEGFRAWTPPLFCALAILYGGLTLWTVRQESAVNYGLERSLHGEGSYLADLTGKPWPGPVR